MQWAVTTHRLQFAAEVHVERHCVGVDLQRQLPVCSDEVRPATLRRSESSLQQVDNNSGVWGLPP